MTRTPDEHHLDPDTWAAEAPRKTGSWWPEWVDWLNARSSSAVAPPRLGAPESGYAVLADAPGRYVLEP